VDRVIPVAIRRWRKNPLKGFTGPEWRCARAALRESHYDAAIDAQGLLKSAFITRLVRAPRYGMDWRSARERLAALAYDHPVQVARDMHAVERTRLLFARALDYPLPATPGDYGLRGSLPPMAASRPPGLLFFHGTARAEKLWPEAHWAALAQSAGAAGFRVWLPWGSEVERERAERIAGEGDNMEVLPRLGLLDLAELLLQAAGAVAVDTGLGHLSAALDVPTVSLYGPTRTRLIGAYGNNQVHLESPLQGNGGAGPAAMMQAITPGQVWLALRAMLPGAA
jgi:heptosyltransferase-1